MHRRARRSAQPLGGMLLLRSVAAFTPSLFLSACVLGWPRDGLVVISGYAPTSETSRCTLAVGPIGGGVKPQARPVEGPFKESFVIYPSHHGHRASLQCGAVGLVAERTFKYGRDVNIGGEIRLDGHAP